MNIFEFFVEFFFFFVVVRCRRPNSKLHHRKRTCSRPLLLLLHRCFLASSASSRSFSIFLVCDANAPSFVLSRLRRYPRPCTFSRFQNAQRQKTKRKNKLSSARFCCAPRCERRNRENPRVSRAMIETMMLMKKKKTNGGRDKSALESARRTNSRAESLKTTIFFAKKF